MPSTPCSTMQSSTRRCPSASMSPEGVNGVGAIGNTPVHLGNAGSDKTTSRERGGYMSVATKLRRRPVPSGGLCALYHPARVSQHANVQRSGPAGSGVGRTECPHRGPFAASRRVAIPAVRSRPSPAPSAESLPRPTIAGEPAPAPPDEQNVIEPLRKPRLLGTGDDGLEQDSRCAQRPRSE